MNEQLKTHSTRRVVIGAILGALLAVGCTLGLHFANVIRLPFLPTSAEIALALSLDKVAKDGSFDVSADVEITIEVNDSSDKARDPIELDASAAGSGAVRNFNLGDPCSFSIEDGTMSLSANASNGATIKAAGAFEADLAKEVLEIVFEEPFPIAVKNRIDVDALKQSRDSDITVKSLEVEGDTARIVIDGKSLAESKAFKDAVEPLGNLGDFETNLSDAIVVLQVDEPNDSIHVSVSLSADVSTVNEPASQAASAVFGLANGLSATFANEEFDAELDGAIKASIDVSVFGHTVPAKLTIDVFGSCSASFHASEGVAGIEVNDGAFGTEVDTIDLLEDVLSGLNCRGTFSFDGEKGLFEYDLEKPLALSGAIEVDTSRPTLRQTGTRSSSSSWEVKNVEAGDSALAITIDGESLMSDSTMGIVLDELARAIGADALEVSDFEIMLAGDAEDEMATIAIRCPCIVKNLALPSPVGSTDVQTTLVAELTIAPKS